LAVAVGYFAPYCHFYQFVSYPLISQTPNIKGKAMPASFQKNSGSAFKQQPSPTKLQLFFIIGAIMILIRIYLHVSNSVSYFF
jgi:hypothetical protein